MRLIVYSKPNCPQCDSAKDMITKSGKLYEERILDMGQSKDSSKKYYTVKELKELVPGAKSVPQIFQVDDNGKNYVGGLKELGLALM